jgi:hypothetical protein
MVGVNGLDGWVDNVTGCREGNLVDNDDWRVVMSA